MLVWEVGNHCLCLLLYLLVLLGEATVNCCSPLLHDVVSSAQEAFSLSFCGS